MMHRLIGSMTLVLVSACSEYELNSDEKVGEPVDTAVELPDISITPPEISVSGVCGSTDAERR